MIGQGLDLPEISPTFFHLNFGHPRGHIGKNKFSPTPSCLMGLSPPLYGVRWNRVLSFFFCFRCGWWLLPMLVFTGQSSVYGSHLVGHHIYFHQHSYLIQKSVCWNIIAGSGVQPACQTWILFMVFAAPSWVWNILHSLHSQLIYFNMMS